MTKQEIISLLTGNFYERFAEQTANIIIKSESMDALFELLEDAIIFSCSKREFNETARNTNYLISISREESRKFEFRAAYVIEFIYFSDSKKFEHYYSHFFKLFPLVTNESAKRHFTKIMANILNKGRYQADQTDYEAIATSCIDWIINKKVRVAVQIWAIECLIVLQHRVEWVSEILEEILQNLSVNPSPAMIVRLRRWKG